MSTPTSTSGRSALLSILLVAMALAGTANAAAATGPVWRIDSVQNTRIAPGESSDFIVLVRNMGDADTDGSQIDLVVTLPAGLTAAEAVLFDPFGGFLEGACTAGDGSPIVAGVTDSVKCSNSQPVLNAINSGFLHWQQLKLTVVADPGAAGTLTSGFAVSGGGAPGDSTVGAIVVGEPPAFGIDTFDVQAADAAGTTFAQAGGHPYEYTTHLDFNSLTDPAPLKGSVWPVEPAKDVIVELPPGFVGNPTALDTCTGAELSNASGTIPQPLCPPSSQAGTISIRFNGWFSQRSSFGPMPIYNMEPPPGVPARFGFALFGSTVALNAELRSGGDYGLSVAGENIVEALPLSGVTTTFWGFPSSPDHEGERACAGKGSAPPSCASDAEPRAFLRLPTSCSAAGKGLPTTVRTDSWSDPGDFAEETIETHELPGFPYPPSLWGDPLGTEGCGEVPFTPALSAAPTTDAADSPSGLTVDIGVPQDCWDAESEICQSDLRNAVVTLPEGMTLNPSAASGLGACSEQQISLNTSGPDSCPADSKIGSVRIETPLLDHPVSGAVYLAQPQQNKFGSLLALYLVVDDAESGVRIKLAGRVSAEADTGRLTTSFEDNPQLPFSNLHLELFGGPRAALRTPPSCGSYATQASLTPWSGSGAVSLSSSFAITNCGNGGFDPQLSAGTANPLAATFSPFSLRLTRADGSQELGAISATLPPGLLASLRGVPYCPDSALAAVSGALGAGAGELAQPSCPAASRLGAVIVGAGAGPNPFYAQTGKAYLAGPYKGAPLSLAVLTPALAGPFDLGNVLVRNALRVDPETATVSAVSDPLPSILHGIPVDLRDIRVSLDRPGFTLNPTSCDPMTITSTITSTRGTTANPSSRFQVAGCDRLAFKPRLSLRLRGSTRRSGFPSLRASLSMPGGGTNIARASVALPRSEFLAQSHIRTICTRVQFAARSCPKGSIYGHARATSPLLDAPLRGPVYLRSSDNPLPDLVAALDGQIEIDLVGRIDSKDGGIRTTFATVPDAPVSRFVLTMRGGRRGLLENSRNLCRSPHRATVKLDAHNGKIRNSRPVLRVDCGRGRGKGHRQR
jgi:hypothetical protein